MTWVWVAIGLVVTYLILFGLCAAAGRGDRIMDRWRR